MGQNGFPKKKQKGQARLFRPGKQLRELAKRIERDPSVEFLPSDVHDLYALADHIDEITRSHIETQNENIRVHSERLDAITFTSFQRRVEAIACCLMAGVLPAAMSGEWAGVVIADWEKADVEKRAHCLRTARSLLVGSAAVERVKYQDDLAALELVTEETNPHEP